MASIQLQNVSVDFPIYNGKTRSLKKRLLQAATGGQIGAKADGCIVVRALTDFNLNLKDGDRIGLLGLNGSGKSTLLRVLGGIYTPTVGHAKIEGMVGSLIDLSLGIDKEATGRENIFMRGCLLGLKKAEISDRLDEIVEFSGLGNFIDMPLRTYSTGMHMRLAFSVSTIAKPEILLMDEWLSVGDESFRDKAEERMKELVRSTNILVVATHSRKLAEYVCNHLVWLEHGKIKMEGDPRDVCEKYFKKNIKKDTEHWLQTL